MKIKFIKSGIIKSEEELGKGLVSQVQYKDLNITNFNLPQVEQTIKMIPIDQDASLVIKIIDAPYFQGVYEILNNYKGMKIVEFQCGDIQIEIGL